LGERDPVQGCVELSVPGSAQPMPRLTATADGTDDHAFAIGNAAFAIAINGNNNTAFAIGNGANAEAMNGNDNTATVVGNNSEATAGPGNNNHVGSFGNGIHHHQP
jgi:hypothetical protein